MALTAWQGSPPRPSHSSIQCSATDATTIMLAICLMHMQIGDRAAISNTCRSIQMRHTSANHTHSTKIVSTKKIHDPTRIAMLPYTDGEATASRPSTVIGTRSLDETQPSRLLLVDNYLGDLGQFDWSTSAY